MNAPSTTPTTLTVTSIADLRAQNEELVMAWARDIVTEELRYILELGPTQRGASCGCECISCGAALIAVNAAKAAYKRRPHFRHPDGTKKDSCLILTAREAIRRLLQPGDLITLPSHREGARITGLSGKDYDAWVKRPAEDVRINSVDFQDGLRAKIRLDDGRELEVHLIGSADVTAESQTGYTPHIQILVDDPAIASLPPEELRRRLVALLSSAVWCGHWNTDEMQAEALAAAQAQADEVLDWSNEDPGLPEDLRRESLLHREVKRILEQSKRLAVPGWEIHNPLTRIPETKVPWLEHLTSTMLEKRLGRIIPDVVAINEDGKELLIEVTVTNTIGPERMSRIGEVGLPTLEIDMSAMGGTVTRSQLAGIITDAVAGKRWLYHPLYQARNDEIVAAYQEALSRRHQQPHAVPAAPPAHRPAPNPFDSIFDRVMKSDKCALEDELAPEVDPIRSVPLSDWVHRYLGYFCDLADLRNYNGYEPDNEGFIDARESAQASLDECIEALAVYGYPEARDARLYDATKLLSRVLSIQLDHGVGYRNHTGWQVTNAIMQDRSASAKSWHTVYLIAINTYKPRIMPTQQWLVDEWRNKVRKSIEEGEELYLRDSALDRLLGLLFPEMRDALAKPKGRRPVTSPHFVAKDVGAGRQVHQPPDSYFDGEHAQRWLWAGPEQLRIQRAGLESRRRDLNGQQARILQFILGKGNNNDPWDVAIFLELTSSIPKAATLRYLFELELITPMATLRKA